MRAVRIRKALIGGGVALIGCLLIGCLPIGCLLAGSALAAPHRDRVFTTSDNVRLHMIEAGPPGGPTLLFIPGWTMPAWIWAAQIQAFSSMYHVVAFDPRGQGASQIPVSGYEPLRRGQDIAEAIAALGGGAGGGAQRPVVIVAWSLGVLDTLAYVHLHGDRRLAGLVLVDNSVGEDPAPTPIPPPRHPPRPLPRADSVRAFVRGMFARPQPAAFLERLTAASLQTPPHVSRALRSYNYPRSFWRDAVYSTNCPILYVVRPRWAAQAANLVRNKPGTESALFMNAGHALFVDEPARFDALLTDFLQRRVWP